MPTYLTFEMNLVEMLLAEVRLPGLRRDFDRETVATRVLSRCSLRSHQSAGLEEGQAFRFRIFGV